MQPFNNPYAGGKGGLPTNPNPQPVTTHPSVSTGPKVNPSPDDIVRNPGAYATTPVKTIKTPTEKGSYNNIGVYRPGG